MTAGQTACSDEARKLLATPVIMHLDRNGSALMSQAEAKYLLSSDAQINVSVIPAGHCHSSSRSATKWGTFQTISVESTSVNAFTLLTLQNFYTTSVPCNWIICLVNILLSTSIHWKQMCCSECCGRSFSRPISFVCFFKCFLFYFIFLHSLPIGSEDYARSSKENNPNSYLLASSCYNQ